MQSPIQPQLNPWQSTDHYRVSNAEDFRVAAAKALGQGTTIELLPRAKFAGLVVPNETKSLWITSADPFKHATIDSGPAGEPAMTLGLGCRDIWLDHLRFRCANGGTSTTVYTLARVGYDATGSREALFVDELPNRVCVQHCEFEGSVTGNNRIGLLANARNLIVRYCQFREFHEVGADSQGILVTNSPGPIEIFRCDIEAAGENVMCGGSVATIRGLQIADVRISHCRLAKPERWKTDGSNWQIKNLLEFKGCVRGLVERNRLENCWPAAQNGTAILLTPRDRSQVSDINIRENLFLSCGSGILITAADSITPAPDKSTGHVELWGNLWHNIGSGGGTIYNLASPGGASIASLSIVGDRWSHHAEGRSVMLLEGVPQAVRQLQMLGCTGTGAKYGIIGTNCAPGLSSLKAWTRDHDIRNCLFFGGPALDFAGDNYRSEV